jgi:DNA polymerase I-like protein with 3'-5' exonuclease and polymerase domains
MPLLLVGRAKVAKMASSFGRPLLDKINPATGRLHCNLKISGAKSGRFSCANPNLQQVPARGEQGAFMRSIFIACGASGLAAFARDAYGVSMTQTEAANAITQFLNTYEGRG